MKVMQIERMFTAVGNDDRSVLAPKSNLHDV